MTPLDNAVSKLTWGSRQKDWSTDLNSSECSALLEEIDRLKEAAIVTVIEEVEP